MVPEAVALRACAIAFRMEQAVRASRGTSEEAAEMASDMKSPFGIDSTRRLAAAALARAKKEAESEY